MKQAIKLLATLIFFFSINSANAQSISDYKFCNHYKFTYFKLKIYDINLCNNQNQSLNYQDLYDQDFALIIEYNINVKRQKFAESSMEEIARYYKLSDLEQKNYYNQLLKVFVDVKPKDQIAAVYQASGVTTFYHNQKETGKITDKNFSKIFLNIWLHPQAHYADMRDDLLSGSKK
ncbi:MAG: chalcone isomerase family protein [Pseudomonadota bacterium]